MIMISSEMMLLSGRLTDLAAPDGTDELQLVSERRGCGW
jgi:hypothetical protein